MSCDGAVRRRIEPLALRAWGHFDDMYNARGVVLPSIPILFFGDLESYLCSSQRVLTVAMNPSGAEFPTENPHMRFPEEIFHSAGNSGGLLDYSAYIDALSGYFQRDPYSFWFKTAFRKMLEGFDASYFQSDSHPNIALHTDLLSCIATSPTWSGLGAKYSNFKKQLTDVGIPLWHDLVVALEPDIVLMSFNPDYLQDIQHVDLVAVDPCYQVKKASGIALAKKAISRVAEKNVLWIWGSPGRLPFLKFNSSEKEILLSNIKDDLLRS